MGEVQHNTAHAVQLNSDTVHLLKSTVCKNKIKKVPRPIAAETEGHLLRNPLYGDPSLLRQC